MVSFLLKSNPVNLIGDPYLQPAAAFADQAIVIDTFLILCYLSKTLHVFIQIYYLVSHILHFSASRSLSVHLYSMPCCTKPDPWNLLPGSHCQGVHHSHKYEWS